MKALSFLFLGALFATTTNAQSWEWTQQSTNSTDYVRSNSISADRLGNVFVAGSTAGSAQIGALSIDPGFFIAKFTAAGQVEWTRSMPYWGYVTADKQGGFYYAANNSMISDSVASSRDINKYVITRFNGDGEQLWTSTGSGGFHELIVSDEGQIFLLSDNMPAKDTVRFNTTYFVIPNPNGSYFQLQSISPTGELIWTTRGLQQADTLAFYKGGALAFDKYNRLCVAGIGQFDGRECEGCGPTFFLSYFNQNGELEKYLPGHKLGYRYSTRWALAFDSRNDVFIENAFTVVGHDSLMKVTTEINKGYYYTELFHRERIYIDNSDRLYMAGYYVDKLYDFCNVQVSPRGETNFALNVFDTKGGCHALYTSIGPGTDEITDYTLDGNGNIYLTGTFQRGSQDEPYSIGNLQMNNDGQHRDFFVAKIKSNVTAIPERNATNTTLRLFPNPAGNSISIKGADSIERVNIYSTTGAFVATLLPQSDHSFDTSMLEEGLYLLKAEGHGITHRARLVISR